MDIVAIITARGGSKGLPRKNVRMLNGKPLIVHTIEASLQSTAVTRCVVTTEDPEIKKVSLEAGAEVVDRPPELSGAQSLSRDAVQHALEALSASGGTPEFFMLLQPTSPLRTAVHIDECVRFFQAKGSNGSCISVCKATHSPFKMLQLQQDQLFPVTDWIDLEKPRQDLPETFRANGAMYLTRSVDFIAKQTFFVQPVIPFLMNELDSIDIDSLEDLMRCERIIAESGWGNVSYEESE